MSSLIEPLERWRQAGVEYQHRGHRIFYRLHGVPGREPALVLIHGFPTASWDWHRVWDRLRERFACIIAPDMLGFGFSAKPAGYRYSILDQADLHQGLLRALGVGRYHIVAHDYGDTVAQELLARQQAAPGAEPVALSCALLNGGLFPEVHRPRVVQQLLASPLGPLVARLTTRRQFERSFPRIFGARTRPQPQELLGFWQLLEDGQGQRVLHRLIRYLGERRQHRSRWVGALQQAPVPLRFINGTDDPVSGLHMAERYRELVPQPDIVLLSGIGHYPQVEDPDAVLHALAEFHRSLRV